MKLKIKIRLLDPKCMPEQHGECFDLAVSKDYTISPNKVTLCELGVVMELPKGYEANVYNRSGGVIKYGYYNPSAFGMIDNAYCGNEDIWKWPLTSITDETILIKKGMRVCQFRVHLSQLATPWQKFKNLFYNGIEFEIVDNMTNPNRGGFGHTGR